MSLRRREWRSGPEPPDIRSGEPRQPRYLGEGVRSGCRRRNAAQKESQEPSRAGGPRDVYQNRLVVPDRLRAGSHGARRPRHPAPAEPLRIRKRAARSAERPVGAGEGQAALRRRSLALQQEWRGARCFLRADGALPDRGRLRDAPGDVGGLRAAGKFGAQDLRARRHRTALSAEREWHAVRPAHVPGARLSRATRGARGTRTEIPAEPAYPSAATGALSPATVRPSTARNARDWTPG